ncbi:TPA: dTMP kinase [Candidatus Bathyarchaeota archaeon]|nr:dTMP kinase [Candidatus Bathyarchaeota archaeon]
MAPRGWFIVFEGVDGSGKSTQIELLSMKLRDQGVDHVLEREPSDGGIGLFIRDYAEAGDRYLQPESEALLFTADRFEHSKRIEQTLEQGTTVVCDRYYHSTLAYQGAAGVDVAWLRDLQKFALKPDLVLLLDVDPTKSLMRVSGRTLTVFENRDYLSRVRELYLGFAGAGEMRLVDTGRPVDEVESEVERLVEELIGVSF